MNPGVAVVTDSTSYLPASLLRGSGVRIVPVQVVMGGQAEDETSEESSVRRVAEALRAWQPVTTSRPSPERFRECFESAVRDGATGIVCATLSRRMSGTYDSAMLAAKETDVDVRVVDSRTVAMALGFAVLAGDAGAREGASLDDVQQIIERRAWNSTSLFYVDTLEYLRRGGRIGSTRAAVGQALKVKPILRILDGEVVPLDRVRTTGKAIGRLTDLALGSAESRPVEFAVQHLDAEGRAEELAATLRRRRPDCPVVVCPLGAAVGAHTGPGIVSVAVSPVG